jgi:hypothetical protein
MAINETRKEKIKSDIFVLSLKFFSLPIIVAIIFLFYVFMLKKDIHIIIPELLNINNYDYNIKKLAILGYSEIEIVQYIKLYDFLLCLIFIFIVPYFVILSKFLFGTTPAHIKSYLIIAHMKFPNFLKVIVGIVMFSFGIYQFGIYFLYYLAGFEIAIIRSGNLKFFLFYRIELGIIFLAAVFGGWVILYKYILLKHRLKSKKNAKVV